MRKRCTICRTPLRANSATNLCAAHYQAARKAGAPEARPIITTHCEVCRKELRHDNASGLCTEHMKAGRTMASTDTRSARDHLAELLRVERDPCTYCGVRADIGCKHQVLAA